MTGRHLESVLASEPGPHVGALFDFDGTIIAGYSAFALLQEKLERRELSAEQIIETANAMVQYSLGSIGFSGLMSSAAGLVKGISEESYRRFGEELYEKHIARRIYPESRALIQAHQARGHTVAIVSSATPYQVEPSARDLDIAHVLCSKYEVENGVFTGNIVRPLCFGEGKVLAAEGLARSHGIDLSRSFFYTDSDDDLELLERVGNPRPLNANATLQGIARQRGWPTDRFASRGTPGPVDFARTLAATGALVGAFAAGLPIWALTGSRRAATNFSVGLFGDVAAAITGLELDVRGEHNLWVSRPCVFVFNHQSKADVMIVAKLIRRDFGGVGKKEIQDMPVIGQILGYAGAVFVDRQNSGDAIRAMAPLVDAIRDDGKSIVIAPEGTRTLTPKLGPFKKGAFHLAMQAGVPIVPIVIHNAGDIAPKHEFVMRPASVRVDVLPPVDTSRWRAESIAQHVAEVRGLFLEALGQGPASTAAEPEPSAAPPATSTPARRRSPARARAKSTARAARPRRKPA
jgi:putative phosphoserine phosphatase/1-acylglycerol-3-phosphate O-acyltransferase